MNRQRKLLVGVWTLLWILPVATIACPPDCGDCYYWNGYYCQPEGDCQSVYGCAPECHRCANCVCVSVDLYCRYVYSACHYCDPNGECRNSCDPNQVCINGQCVTVTLSVTASKQDPALCEDVTFTATTDPTGYEQYVTWSAPGGEPDYGYEGSTFTTHWPCKGTGTATATLGSLSASANVNVVLPEGCAEGGKSVSLQATVLSTEVNCPAGPCGKTALLAFPEPSVSAAYDGCAWAFQVAANAYVESGVCRWNFVETTGPEDVNSATYCGVVYRFVVRNGCYPNADGTINSNSDCVLAHEAKHVEIFEREFADRSSWLASQPSMSDMAIDCSDANTTTCQAAASARQAAITSDVRQACLDAWAVADDETLAEAAAQICFWSVADDLCSYAYGHGWPGCPYCPE